MNKEISGLLITVGIALGGCASPAKNTGPIRISPDTYTVSATGWLPNVPIGSVKKVVFEEANKFAESKGKIMIPLSVKDSPATSNKIASCELNFRVLDTSDPEARRTSLVPRADVVIEKTETISTDVRVKEEKAPDLYAELTKLDDLRKRGILTEAEFTSQKKRLLESK
ncbi:MAG: hypothetical protein RLZZ15_4614 [Verrucomicrobiota bacterium]